MFSFNYDWKILREIKILNLTKEKLNEFREIKFSGGMGNRNPGFGYPQYISVEKWVEGIHRQVKQGFSLFVAKFLSHLMIFSKWSTAELWKIIKYGKQKLAKNEEKSFSAYLLLIFRLISGRYLLSTCIYRRDNELRSHAMLSVVTVSFISYLLEV